VSRKTKPKPVRPRAPRPASPASQPLQLPSWLLAGLILAVNAAVIGPYYGVEYTRQMGSIEAAFIGLARYISGHFPNFGWFPLWYAGIPFQDAYPPLLHFIVAACASAANVSPAYAYHAVTAVIYALCPVALFWALSSLGATPLPSFLGALGYSLLSPSVWLVEAIRNDAGGFLGPRRMSTLVRYGEGPHALSLLLVPVALALLHSAITRRRRLLDVLSALSMAAVALSNWLGAVALAFVVFAYLLSSLHGMGLRAWVKTACLGAAAYAASSPWLPPSTIGTIRTNAPILVGHLRPGWPWVAGAIAGFVILLLLLSKLRAAPLLRFGVLSLYPPAAITLLACWFGVSLLPQSERYHLELDVTFWMLAAILIALVPPLRAGRYAQPLVAAAVLLCAVPVVSRQRAVTAGEASPIAIETTAEYKVSRWLGEHMPGRRVFAPGSISFWMTAFSDTPMLPGGFDNGIRNKTLWQANYGILTAAALPDALSLLKAFGCDAVVGGAPTSKEWYHPYSHPEKFASLAELWRHGPEVVYAVPRLRPSLAHALRPSSLAAPLTDYRDVKPLARYVAALDDPGLPDVSFQWKNGDISSGAAVVTANLRPEHVVSIQISHTPGWEAAVNGRPLTVARDNIGQIVLEPACDGPCRIELFYTGGLEMTLARSASAALAACVLWLLWPALRRRAGRAGLQHP
jgi:hypothetical protein